MHDYVYIAKTLLQLPGCLILGFAAVFLLRIVLGATISYIALSLLTILWWLLSTPIGSYWLTKPLLLYPALEQQNLAKIQAQHPVPQAIVVLGGGRKFTTPEYDGAVMPGEATLIRLTYATHLWQKTNAPVMTVGGQGQSPWFTTPTGDSEGLMMARVLRDFFNVPVTWQEQYSGNTYENAVNAAAILKDHGINRVFLLTAAEHMHRSVLVFEAEGIAVVPAPTNFPRPVSASHWGSWLPSPAAFARSARSWHEWFGILWYRINGYF